MIIEFGGVTFNDTGRGWVFADLIDWYTLPDSKAPNEPLPQGHGSFNPGTDWRTAAAISFTAGYIGDTHAECLSAVETLTAVGSSTGSETIRVTDALRPTSRTVSVRHIGVPDFFDYDNHEVHFAVDLLAWDPVRYADPDTVSTALPTAGGGLEYELGEPSESLYYGALGNLGRVTLTNAGTADTWPVFEVTGQLTSGFYLQCLETGQMIRYDRVVPSGTSVTIDSRTGEVLIDGISDASTYLTQDEWFPVPAGGSATVQFNALGGSSGTPMLEVTSWSGWW